MLFEAAHRRGGLLVCQHLPIEIHRVEVVLRRSYDVLDHRLTARVQLPECSNPPMRCGAVFSKHPGIPSSMAFLAPPPARQTEGDDDEPASNVVDDAQRWGGTLESEG